MKSLVEDVKNVIVQIFRTGRRVNVTINVQKFTCTLIAHIWIKFSRKSYKLYKKNKLPESVIFCSVNAEYLAAGMND